jgi:ribosomal protein L11 methyltransferase
METVKGRHSTMNIDDVFIAVHFDTLDDMENVQAQVLTMDPAGILEDDSGWECYFLKNDWMSGTADTFTRAAKEHFPAIRWQTREIFPENWNAEWEKTITTLHIGERLVITPTWQPYDPKPGEIVLIIDPKMSFGTGFHATTRLLEQFASHGQRVFDVGTGTGVLAIAAVKLGAREAIGIDIDEWSMDNAMENIERNSVVNRVTVSRDDAASVEGPFDLVLSNITKNDNIELLAAFKNCTAPDGYLILSGFYGTDVDDVAAAAHMHGFQLVTLLEEDEWAACVLRR